MLPLNAIRAVAAALVVSCFTHGANADNGRAQTAEPVIIDTDIGDDIDDAFALGLALADSRLQILGITTAEEGRVAIEVHDSGPGLSEQARSSLFEPTISFKKKGMGLGLSIARKSALLCGGDIVLVKGELGGAGFRVLLPVVTNGFQTRSDRG